MLFMLLENCMCSRMNFHGSLEVMPLHILAPCHLSVHIWRRATSVSTFGAVPPQHCVPLHEDVLRARRTLTGCQARRPLSGTRDRRPFNGRLSRCPLTGYMCQASLLAIGSQLAGCQLAHVCITCFGLCVQVHVHDSIQVQTASLKV